MRAPDSGGATLKLSLGAQQDAERSRHDRRIMIEVSPPFEERHFGRFGSQVGHPGNFSGLGRPRCIDHFDGAFSGNHLAFGLQVLGKLRRPVERRSRAARFDRHIIDNEAAAAAVLEAESTVGQVGWRERDRTLFADPVDKLFQPKLTIADVGDAHPVTVPRSIAAGAELALVLDRRTGIVDRDLGTTGGVAVEQHIAPRNRAIAVVVVQSDVITDPFGGGLRRQAIGNQVERRLDPGPFGLGGPVEFVVRHQPAAAVGPRFDDLQFALDDLRSRRLRRVDVDPQRSRRRIITGGRIAPAAGKGRGGLIKIIAKYDVAGGPVGGDPHRRTRP